MHGQGIPSPTPPPLFPTRKNPRNERFLMSTCGFKKIMTKNIVWEQNYARQLDEEKKVHAFSQLCPIYNGFRLQPRESIHIYAPICPEGHIL